MQAAATSPACRCRRPRQHRLLHQRSQAGPAAAALPEPFVEAMRRFHDQLPRPSQPQEETGDSDDGEAWESESTEEDGTGWPAGNAGVPSAIQEAEAGEW
jgi:hypothetical protein